MTFRAPKRLNTMQTTTLLIGLVGLTNAQSMIVSNPWIDPSLTYGPVVNIWCQGTFPILSSNRQTKWIFSNRTLTVNGELEEEDSSKYAVELRDGHGGYTLSIYNSVKDDSGTYQCRIEYNIDGKKSYMEREATVNIVHYLPQLNYPECNIGPSATLINGTEATFNCTVGESSVPVNLELTVQRPNRPHTQLDDTTVTKIVTINDNNTTFICLMTSDAFPTAHRTCSVALTVIPEPTTPVPTPKGLKPVLTPDGSAPVNDSNITGKSSASAIGGTIGALLIITVTIIVIIIILRFKKSKSENQSHTTPGIINGSTGHPTDNIYPRPENAAINSPSPSLDSNPPIYSQVNKTVTKESDYKDSRGLNSEFVDNILYASSGPSANFDGISNSRDDEVYETTQMDPISLDTSSAATNPPIYGKVNKHAKTCVSLSRDDIDAHETIHMDATSLDSSAAPNLPIYGRVNKHAKNCTS